MRRLGVAVCVLLGRRHCTRSQDAVGTHVGVRSRRTVASGATGRRITAIFARDEVRLRDWGNVPLKTYVTREFLPEDAEDMPEAELRILRGEIEITKAQDPEWCHRHREGTPRA